MEVIKTTRDQLMEDLKAEAYRYDGGDDDNLKSEYLDASLEVQEGLIDSYVINGVKYIVE